MSELCGSSGSLANLLSGKLPENGRNESLIVDVQDND